MMRNLSLSIHTVVRSLHSASAARVAVLFYMVSSVLILLFIQMRMNVIRYTTHDIELPPESIEGMLLLSKAHMVWFCVFVLGFAGIIFLEKNRLLSSWITLSLSGLGLLIAVLAAFTGPHTSSDIYNYLAVGRVAIVHGENPFVTAPDEIGDPTIQSLPTPWNFRTSQYGPVLIGIAGIPWLVANTTYGLVLALKIPMLLSYIALTWVIYKIAIVLPYSLPVSVTAALVGNPASLWLMLVDGHIDVVMVLFMLISVLSLLYRHWTIAGVALGVAIAIKVVPVVLLPLFALYIWKRCPVQRCTLNFVLGMLIAISLLYAPFASTISIHSFTELFQPFYQPRSFGLLPSIIYWTAAAITSHVDTLYEFTILYIAPVSRGVLFAGIATVLLYSIREIKSATMLFRFSIVLFTVILITSHYVQPWYLFWLLPFALLITRSARTLYVTTIYLVCIATAGIIFPNSQGFAMSLAALMLPLWGLVLYWIAKRENVLKTRIAS